MCRGSYLAFCEGDDYWIDPKKLQKQVDALMKNPDCDLAFHHYKIKEKETFHDIKRSLKNQQIVSTKEMIINPDYCFTASIMIKKDMLITISPLLDSAPVGDFFERIFGAYPHGAVYLNDTMSVYRKNAINSWSTRKRTYETSCQYIDKMEISIIKLNVLLDQKFNNELSFMLNKFYIGELVSKHMSFINKFAFYFKYRKKISIFRLLFSKYLMNKFFDRLTKQ